MVLALLAAVALFWGYSKEEVRRFRSPDGRYECVVTRYRYEHFVSRFPGQGSDYSCFLSIYDSTRNCGTIPVPMAWMVEDLEWEESGASIKVVGEWDFENRKCFYWSEDQETRISGL